MIAFDEASYPTSKRVGVASEVTLITPIKFGRVPREYRTYRKRLEDVLDDLQWRESQGLPTPVGLLRQIHFARWVILDRPGSAGDLLFTSNFDGDMKHYFRSFALQLTKDIDTVWENCEGYPGAKDFEPLWQYVKRHQITTNTFYNAYPKVTMPQIQQLSALKAGVDEFAFAGEPRPKHDFAALVHSVQMTTPPVAPSQPLPDRAVGKPTSELEREDIQANVLSSPAWKRAEYRFLTIEDPKAFRPAILRLLESGDHDFITAQGFEDARKDRSLSRSMNIAFTWSGLERLGIAKEYLNGMPLAFRQGMAARADILGDVGEWAPDKWQGMLGHCEIHVLIATFSMADDVDDYWREVLTCAREGTKPDGPSIFPGCRMIQKESGERLWRDGYPVEPFGFRDGIGQPNVEGIDDHKASKQAPIAPGEFILGYADIDGNDQIAKDFVGQFCRDLCLNGTYMVFRKLEQNVAAFKGATGDGDLGSRLFGRRKHGGSLADDRPISNSNHGSPEPRVLDNFDYGDDPDGKKCPFGSHARRTNPRNEEARRHRIIRRGIPYKEGDEEGMLFVCFNARIDSQFEFLQSEWCKKGDFLGSFTEARDPIVGGGGVFFDPKHSVPLLVESFVTLKGGEYFFMPGMRALDHIAQGDFDHAPHLDVKVNEAPPEAIYPAGLAEQMFDPVHHAEDVSAMAALLTNRSIEERRVAWASGKPQAVYYVACRDHVRQILQDDETFPSAQYARKLSALLADYNFGAWLRSGETTPDTKPFRNFLLGMTHKEPEKRRRLDMLRAALTASSVDDLRARLGSGVEAVATTIVGDAILENPGGFDVVDSIAYKLPLAYAVECLGYPDLKGFSQAYKTLYFERESIEEVRALGFLDFFPKGGDLRTLKPELFMLVHTIAIFLLIDQYDTPSALQFARIAVKELLDRLAEQVKEEEDRITSTGQTLLSLLLQRRPPGADPAEFRIRAGMIVAELVVGGIDTTAKGITNVVDFLLSNPDAVRVARDAVKARDDAKLNNVILEALRLKPVAPLIVRECPSEGASLQLKKDKFRFEPGSRLFLIMDAAMRDPDAEPLPPGVDLQKFMLDRSAEMQTALDPIRRLAFGDGPHGCLGPEIVLAQIRGVLKQLLASKLDNFRRAAGLAGQKEERFSLPVSLAVRFDPQPS
jgi:Dyp-type peroxidase family